ncbi:Lrp/AsnC family transcriptional regulator [Picrophilus oshimae]|uniref:Transcriptional regulator protein, AsnC family n=1 Tax=Picrophilus torridus (strain ATCC 700027 / DSM 9790 / JCM 10055 / NBRC 100828 / KAW 2/3) TaxID=1122961 RepID=Q6L241_PICTO|nr:AsnC family transcriptional regulator [Picrophilus oshimae]AAT42961.1 transcriptional regulator protein, AsnC family [Picrophilus oshimae DSM 9789]SMD30737.1 transcriptional regulator, AsnC family [Picrophilus oshimae DSM 9789]
MDDLDLKIIREIRNNGKASIREIARRCSVSPGTVRNRIIEMEKEHIIIGFKARLQGKKIGMEEAILGLDVSPEHYFETLESIKNLNFISEVYSTSGDHSAIAIIECNENEMNKCISQILKINGVRNVYPSLVNTVIK